MAVSMPRAREHIASCLRLVVGKSDCEAVRAQSVDEPLHLAHQDLLHDKQTVQWEEEELFTATMCSVTCAALSTASTDCMPLVGAWAWWKIPCRTKVAMLTVLPTRSFTAHTSPKKA